MAYSISFDEARFIRNNYRLEESIKVWEGCNDAKMLRPFENGNYMSGMVVSHARRMYRKPTIDEFYGAPIVGGPQAERNSNV